MAEPGTSYISIRSREMLKNNGVYSKKRHFYTGLIDWSLLVKRGARAVTGPACN